ncbi:putative Major facilitator superfamily (MFS) profile domain-containing protein [Seiridium unicorne]|uniref:Major facilitator superfamily (MFS) profile domain-containing protein n=1 Tax=Seiridium unicorne TaxID=138068 RepID=A0ABR2UEA1_9PEZI
MTTTPLAANSATTTLAGSRAPSAYLVPIGGGEEKNTLASGPESTKDDVERQAGLDAGEKEGKDVFDRYPDNIVGWDGPGDLESPRNWPVAKKLCFVAVTSAVIAAVSFGSSVFGPAAKATAAEFDVPVIVMRLAVALWILGFAAGPVVFGPLSELFGHVPVFAMAVVGLSIFQIPIAVGQNVQTVLVCRFFSGVFGSGAFAVVSGMYVELYEPIPRGVALGMSSICINLGATIAPMAGAYITKGSGSEWRWTAWATLIIMGTFGIAALFCVRESSSRMILRYKAKRLRFETKNWALHAKSEETRVEFSDIIHRYLTKPVRMFITEPILIIFTAYLTLVYGTLYLSFQAFPVAFQERGWSTQASTLPFIAVVCGVITAWIVQSIFTMTWYKSRSMQLHGPLAPEYRLPPMMVGAVTLPPSLLWFGWSGNVHAASQIIATYFIGLGLMLIFVPGISYIVDVYGFHSNSAMSIHVVVRSLVSCSFPMFANIMYDQLGVAWASSLLAFLCVALAPAPLLFWVYGKKIRSWSTFAFD